MKPFQEDLFPLKKLPVELPGEAQPEVGGSPQRHPVSPGLRSPGPEAEVGGARRN
jgi:hypothetical protein